MLLSRKGYCPVSLDSLSAIEVGVDVSRDQSQRVDDREYENRNINGLWFGAQRPHADTNPRRGYTPDDIASESDDDETDEVCAEYDSEAGPGMGLIVDRSTVIRRSVRQAKLYEECEREHEGELEHKEESEGRVDEGHVERSRSGWSVVCEQRYVGIQQQDEENALENCGSEEPFEDPCYCPQGHDPICKHQGQSNSLGQSSFCFWFSRKNKKNAVAYLPQIHGRQIH